MGLFKSKEEKILDKRNEYEKKKAENLNSRLKESENKKREADALLELEREKTNREAQIHASIEKEKRKTLDKELEVQKELLALEKKAVKLHNKQENKEARKQFIGSLMNKTKEALETRVAKAEETSIGKIEVEVDNMDEAEKKKLLRNAIRVTGKINNGSMSEISGNIYLTEKFLLFQLSQVGILGSVTGSAKSAEFFMSFEDIYDCKFKKGMMGLNNKIIFLMKDTITYKSLYSERAGEIIFEFGKSDITFAEQLCSKLKDLL